jgi:YHS domain-containing protein
MMRSHLAFLVAAGLVAACGGPLAPKQAEAVRLTPAQVASRLAAADLADGTQDKVVAKCAGCGLAMDGDPRYASAYAGYQLHFCSPECKQRFDAGPDKVLAKLPDTPRS